MKRTCKKCGKRPAKFVLRGKWVKADDNHDLCIQCWRRETDRARAEQVARQASA